MRLGELGCSKRQGQCVAGSCLLSTSAADSSQAIWIYPSFLVCTPSRRIIRFADTYTFISWFVHSSIHTSIHLSIHPSRSHPCIHTFFIHICICSTYIFAHVCRPFLLCFNASSSTAAFYKDRRSRCLQGCLFRWPQYVIHRPPFGL